MANDILIDDNKPVTKGLLKAFGVKSKQMFKEKAIPALTQTESSILLIKTSLPFEATSGSEGSFDQLFLTVKGTAKLNTERRGINLLVASAATGNSSVLTFAEGYNRGQAIIEKVVFYRDDEESSSSDDSGSLSIALFLRSGWVFEKCLVDIEASLETTVLNQFVISIATIAEFNMPSAYKYIDYTDISDDSSSDDSDSDENDEYYYLSNRIGDIYIAAASETVFGLKTGVEYDDEDVIDYYNPGKVFDTIYKSVFTSKLDHNVTITYDFSDTVDDETDTVYEGNLSGEPNGHIVLKAPSFSNASTSTGETWSSVTVKKGIVTSGTSGFPVATSDTVGGIKLGSDADKANTDNANKIYLELDAQNKAYIGKDSFADLIYRVDLNSEAFKTHASDYKNLIVQHIGVTSLDYINGFFYKSLRSQLNFVLQGLPNEGETTVNMGHPFIFSSGFGSKLYDYLYDTHSTINVDGTLVIYIIDSTSDESSSSEESDDPMDSYVYAIKNQGGTDYISFTRTQLVDTLGVLVLNGSQWNPDGTKEISAATFTFKFTDTEDYYWKPWEVQAEPQLPPILRYKGEVEEYAQLHYIENPREGDVWHVQETGAEYFYVEDPEVSGTETWEDHWQLLGKDVYNSKLTIQGNGTTAVEFNANSNSDKTLNITGQNLISLSATNNQITITTNDTDPRLLYTSKTNNSTFAFDEEVYPDECHYIQHGLLGLYRIDCLSQLNGNVNITFAAPISPMASARAVKATLLVKNARQGPGSIHVRFNKYNCGLYFMHGTFYNGTWPETSENIYYCSVNSGEFLMVEATWCPDCGWFLKAFLEVEPVS